MKLRFSERAYRLFELFLIPLEKISFSKILLLNEANFNKQKNFFLVSNHISWWDGFLLRKAQRRFFHKHDLYTFMLESEIIKFPYFRKMGGIGLEPGSAAQSRKIIHQLKNNKRASAYLFYPQGAIFPHYKRPLGFKKGIQLFTKAVEEPSIIPVAMAILPLNDRKPIAFIHLGKNIEGEGLSETKLHTKLERCSTEMLDRFEALSSQEGEKTVETLVAQGAELC